MNPRIEKLAVDAGLLNYVDNETPRRYFVDGYADLEEVEKFAELILKEVIIICDEVQTQYGRYTFTATTVKDRVKEHFGVEL